jgi:hypothetical protein
MNERIQTITIHEKPYDRKRTMKWLMIFGIIDLLLGILIITTR